MSAGGYEAAGDNLFFMDVEIEEEIKKPTIQKWEGNLAGDIDYIIPFDCLARTIQQWILKGSMYPQPAIAYAAAMSVLSVCIGRDIAIDNIKGNIMTIAMAESGEGKDYPFKAARRILDAVNLGHKVQSKMASGAALIEALSDNPSMLLHVDEMGNYLDSINGFGANNYAKEIVGIITECYTSASDRFRGKRTKGNEPDDIVEPNLCVMGLSSERQVMDGLSSKDVANGSLARYLFMFGESGLMPKRVVSADFDTVPDEIVSGLNELIDKYSKRSLNTAVKLPVSDEYREEMWQLTCTMKKRANSLASAGGEKAAFVPFLNRIAFRSFQFSMLIDSSCNVEVLKWVADKDLKSSELFSKKFRHVSGDNENEKNQKLIIAIIKESGKAGISKSTLTRRAGRLNPIVRAAILADFESSGLVYVEKKRVKNSRKESNVYFWIK